MYYLLEKLNLHKLNFTILNKLSKSIKEKVIMLILIMFILFLLVLFILRILKVGVSEQVDNNKKIIYFGETCDLENNETSKDYSKGYQLAFSSVNRKGGVNGYIIKLILLNDKYETELAIKNAKLLIDYYNVLAIIGTFGTPTTVGILTEAIADRHIPLIGPFSAGTSYRKYFTEYLITTNTSFYPEFDLIIENMLQNSYHNISILFQNDIYGNYFYNAFVDYILEKNLPFNILSSGKYERNSDDLDNTFKTIFNVTNPYDYSGYNKNKIKKIQAILIFTAEKEISSILGQLKKISPSIAIYYNFFVGTRKSNLQYLKYENTDNIYQTLLSHSTIEDYPELNKLLNNEINEHNKNNIIKIDEINSSLIQGFYSGMMICKVLENFENMTEINRKTFTEMFYKMKTIDVYGFPMGPFIMGQNNEAIKYVELNQLQDDLEFKLIKSMNFGEYKSK